MLRKANHYARAAVVHSYKVSTITRLPILAFLVLERLLDSMVQESKFLFGEKQIMDNFEKEKIDLLSSANLVFLHDIFLYELLKMDIKENFLSKHTMQM